MLCEFYVGVTMKIRKRKNTLSSQYLIRITKIFENNKWSIENEEITHVSLFNRYCERILDLGENKKRDLMLELTERYLWIPEEKYLEHLIDALVNLITIKPEINSKVTIYVMPIVSPRDRHKIKSATMVTYLFNNVKLRYHPQLSKYKFVIVDEESQLFHNLEDTESIILLVDDYIGTGETAEKCILHMIDKRVPIKQMALISLVAQELGLNYLNKYNINIAVSLICRKGITDYYKGQELDIKLNLMKEIERKMAVKDKYKLGYGESEALVTMCRTPNNTFPLFWEENGNMRVAPFPRL